MKIFSIYIIVFITLLIIITPLIFLESTGNLNNVNYLLENSKEYFNYMKNNALAYIIGFLGGTITLYALNLKK